MDTNTPTRAGQPVAVAPGAPGGELGEVLAAARLSAAAPELLAALNEILAHPSLRPVFAALPNLDRIARAAVAKAEGKA